MPLYHQKQYLSSFLKTDIKKYHFSLMLVMAATMLAAQSIQLGVNDIVVAGGMESMSNVPKYLAEARLTFPTSWLIILLNFLLIQIMTCDFIYLFISFSTSK